MTNKPQHTPGPWAVNADDGEGISVIGKTGGARGSQHVATVVYDDAAQKDYLPHTPSRAESQANARLIAAAPELLEALEGMIELFVDSDQISGCDDYETVKMARAAIAKARGQA